MVVNLGTEEVKHSNGKDYKPGKGVINCRGIKCTGVIIIKGVPDLIYLPEEGYYYVVLLSHAVRAALTLLYI